MTDDIKIQVVKTRLNVPSRRVIGKYTWAVERHAHRWLHSNWFRIHQDGKELLNTFVRVNNKKKLHYCEDFVKAGYPYLLLSDELMDEFHSIKAWCTETFGKNKVAIFGYNATIVFENENDRTLFLLMWGQ